MNNITIEDLNPTHINNPSVQVQKLIDEYNEAPGLCPYSGAVYCLPLLKHIDTNILFQCEMSNNSMISRCIEHNLPEQLIYILSHNIQCDKYLYLRFIGSVELYTYARAFGYKDIELEKRVIWLQRIFRARRNKEKRPTIYHRYQGPDIDIHYLSGSYFGYRKSIYQIRWNKKNIEHFRGSLLKHNCYGNCEWEAHENMYNRTLS